MTTILIPTRVRYSFHGGVGQVVRMLGAVAPDCGHSLIDLDGVTIGGPSPTQSRTPWVTLKRRLLHLRTLAFFPSFFPRTPLVFFQTSLNKNSLLRDTAYMRRCHRTGRPFSVLVHGWNEQFADSVSASSRRRKRLARILNQANRILVLAPNFADTLALWGVEKAKILVETTMIDDDIFADFDIEEKIRSRKARHGLQILFMSRIVKQKGIYQAIEAFRAHSARFPDSSLLIAGDGEELQAVKDHVNRESIEGVRIVGFVDGPEKRNVLANADVFLFPSFYGEGLPVTLLEAMAFGSTVISRPVGGIGHFFIEPEMGYVDASLDPHRFGALLDKVAQNPNLWAATARFNHWFSRENVLASRVCRRILDEVTKDIG